MVSYGLRPCVSCSLWDLISQKKLNYILDSKSIDILVLSFVKNGGIFRATRSLIEEVKNGQLYVYGMSQFFLFFTSFCDLPE